MKILPFIMLGFLASGCVTLHRVQIGEIDNRNIWKRKKFEVVVSEVGVNLKVAGRVADRVSRSDKGSRGAKVVSYFQMGPKTGNPVYVKDFARRVYDKVRDACPSGRVTGLESIREKNDYYVGSGESVRITGYCLTLKKAISDRRKKKRKKNRRRS